MDLISAPILKTKDCVLLVGNAHSTQQGETALLPLKDLLLTSYVGARIPSPSTLPKVKYSTSAFQLGRSSFLLVLYAQDHSQLVTFYRLDGWMTNLLRTRAKQLFLECPSRSQRVLAT